MTTIQPVPVFGPSFGGREIHKFRPSEVLEFLTLGNGFGGNEQIRRNAAHILVYFKDHEHDVWQMFSIVDLTHFYDQKGWPPELMFDGLITAWTDPAEKTGDIHSPPVYLVNIFLGRFAVTTDFIDECMGKKG